MDYEQIFVSALEKLKHERRYRIFTEIERNAEWFPRARWKSPEGEREIRARLECRWQREHLPAAIRDLVLDDQRLRNYLCWSVFDPATN